MESKPKKRIVHLVVGLEAGGTEIYLSRLLPRLESEFVNTVICMWGHGPMGKELSDQGISVTYLHGTIWGLPLLMFRLCKSLRKNQPDILATYLIHANLLGRLAAYISGVATVICHERGSLERWRRLRILDRMTKGLVTKYVVQSEPAKKLLIEELNISDNRVSVVPNVVFPPKEPVESRETIRQQFGLPLSDQIVVCVGGLRPIKGQQYLIEAFKLCQQRFPQAFLLIIGDGVDRARLEALANNSAIRFLGHQNSDNVYKILRASDIFVLPSIEEGMSNALLEAMCAQKPIIVTAIEANRAILDDSSALFVEPGNANALAAALTTLLSDPDMQKSLASKSFERCQKYLSLESIVANFR